MPLAYARALTGRQRTPAANRHLGYTLSAVAGAVNAGGFLAVRQYTSHMTGIVSSMADELVLGNPGVVLTGFGAVVSFVSGAATCALLVNHARRRQWHGEYALPLLLEALLLLCFGLTGARLALLPGLFVPATVMLLCFTMGLQNAVITKISKAEIRTTHVTGIVTDIGIELGKLIHRSMVAPSSVPADMSRLKVLASLLACFFAGGVSGALGFRHLGYGATLPLAMLLVVLASVPAIDDLRAFIGRRHGA